MTTAGFPSEPGHQKNQEQAEDGVLNTELLLPVVFSQAAGGVSGRVSGRRFLILQRKIKCFGLKLKGFSLHKFEPVCPSIYPLIIDAIVRPFRVTVL